MADTNPGDQQKNEKPYVIMALQGGGALGAFQVGAYKALSENRYEPDWVAGISIGAINASIIAGNPQKDRLPRLLRFWDVVARNQDWWDCAPNCSEKLTNLWKVWLSMARGVSGFFQPNFVPGPFTLPNSPEACCLYNTQELRTTLQRLIDFDFLNNYNSPTHVRLSLGATKVFGGVSETFESFGGPNPVDPQCHYTAITTDHIMASGANAPWLPGVRINEQLYWDGGITSNTSFKHIIHHLPAMENRHVVIFVIDLWNAYDDEPKTFEDVCWKMKQIQYCSRLKHDLSYGQHFVDEMRLQKHAKSDKTAAKSKSLIHLVRVCYRCDPNEIPCGDALFSRKEIHRRIEQGCAAMLSLLETHPHPWSLSLRGDDEEGVKIHFC
jgi:NTE family protein